MLGIQFSSTLFSYMAQGQTKQLDSERYHSNSDSYNLDTSFIRVVNIILHRINCSLAILSNVLREVIANTDHLAQNNKLPYSCHTIQFKFLSGLGSVQTILPAKFEKAAIFRDCSGLPD